MTGFWNLMAAWRWHFCPLPPCGGGSGWGGGRLRRGRAAHDEPHPRPLPTRGRGEVFVDLCATILLSIAGACAAAPCAHAAWPDDRPIEIIVGYQAG